MNTSIPKVVLSDHLNISAARLSNHIRLFREELKEKKPIQTVEMFDDKAYKNYF